MRQIWAFCFEAWGRFWLSTLVFGFGFGVQMCDNGDVMVGWTKLGAANILYIVGYVDVVGNEGRPDLYIVHQTLNT